MIVKYHYFIYMYYFNFTNLTFMSPENGFTNKGKDRQNYNRKTLNTKTDLQAKAIKGFFFLFYREIDDFFKSQAKEMYKFTFIWEYQKKKFSFSWDELFYSGRG